MSTKMKGLLKGLRYISQIFEEEEEKEMQIGFPTDVKHVAHIGWDGPSVNSPSWMNEFKSPALGNASAPSQLNGNANDHLEDVEGSSTTKKSVRDSLRRDLSALPKSSRRQPSVDSVGSMDSPLGSPSSQKSNSSRRRQSKQKECSSPRGTESLNSHGVPNIPKKSRRKKSKDSDGSVKPSSKSKDKGLRNGSRHVSDDGSMVKQYSNEVSPSSGLGTLKQEEVKA